MKPKNNVEQQPTTRFMRPWSWKSNVETQATRNEWGHETKNTTRCMRPWSWKTMWKLKQNTISEAMKPQQKHWATANKKIHETMKLKKQCWNSNKNQLVRPCNQQKHMEQQPTTIFMRLWSWKSNVAIQSTKMVRPWNPKNNKIHETMELTKQCGNSSQQKLVMPWNPKNNNTWITFKFVITPWSSKTHSFG